MTNHKLKQWGRSKMENKLIAIDLAKTSFSICCVNEFGKVLSRKTLNREKLHELLNLHQSCRVAMEACGSSNYWGQYAESKGHTVEIISARAVQRITKLQKNDANDAEAIAITANLPGIKNIPIKQKWQQDIQSIHRVRESVIKSRTAIINQTRALLSEYGIVIGVGVSKFRSSLPEILENSENGLTVIMRTLVKMNLDIFLRMEQEQKKLHKMIERISFESPDCIRLMQVPGVGAIAATKFISSIGDPRQFKNGRCAAAWLGLVPRQNTTGGHIKLLGVTKTGDQDLRTTLIHGARSLIQAVVRYDKTDKMSVWIKQLLAKKGWNKTAVAVANKMTRIMWHMIANKEEFNLAKAI